MINCVKTWQFDGIYEFKLEQSHKNAGTIAIVWEPLLQWFNDQQWIVDTNRRMFDELKLQTDVAFRVATVGDQFSEVHVIFTDAAKAMLFKLRWC